MVCMNSAEGFALQCFHCLVCVSVYLSVPALAASASVEDSKQRYSRVSLWILTRGFPSVPKL